MKNKFLLNLKKWGLAVLSALLTLFLLYVGKDYPCLKGAGLALADFEGFLFLCFIAAPCLAWSIFQLFIQKSSLDENWEKRWIDGIARATIIGNFLYAILSLPIIFSYFPHPLHLLCF